MKYLPLILFFYLASCKTSHEVTRTIVERDSTAIRVRDSVVQVISELKQKYQLDIEAIKNTGVTFQPDCPPTNLTIDANCNYDSVQRIINSLKSSVKINKDGSIEAWGRLAGAYSNYDSVRHESLEKDSIIQRLTLQHQSDSSSIKDLTASSRVNDKSKPGGIFSGFWSFAFLGLALLLGGLLVYEKFKKKAT